MDVLEALEQWYKDQCDGEWEHSHGVRIESLDNPGWYVTIDLQDTDLENATLQRKLPSTGDDDYFACWIDCGKFLGAGDPSKLWLILAKFDELRRQTVTSNSPTLMPNESNLA